MFNITVGKDHTFDLCLGGGREYTAVVRPSYHAINVTVQNLKNIAYLYTTAPIDLVVGNSDTQLYRGVHTEPVGSIDIVSFADNARLDKTALFSICESLAIDLSEPILNSKIFAEAESFHELCIRADDAELWFGRLRYLYEVDDILLSSLDPYNLGDMDFIPQE